MTAPTPADLSVLQEIAAGMVEINAFGLARYADSHIWLTREVKEYRDNGWVADPHWQDDWNPAKLTAAGARVLAEHRSPTT